MFRIAGARAAAAILAVAALSAPAFAHAEPDATITLHGSSVAFIVGGGGGDGKLHFHGHTYRLQVSGLSVGAIGVNSFDLSGDVFHLHHVEDIEGTYAAVDASATAGSGGAGILDMTNGAGVEIRAQSSSSGLKLSLGPSGLVIKLRH
jgi:hypothetical protein